MTRTTNPYYFFCPHCGRQWDTTGLGTKRRGTWTETGARIGSNTGFVAAASDNHVSGCVDKTPAQRREANRRDELRWAKSPPRASRIWNDPNHAGLKDSARAALGQGSGK